jgi:hypothetical protein
MTARTHRATVLLAEGDPSDTTDALIKLMRESRLTA